MSRALAAVVSIVVTSCGLLSGCRGVAARTLDSTVRDRLLQIEQQPSSAGERIYEGRVFATDGRPDPLFSYERRVNAVGGIVTSTHVTRDPANAVVVVQSAAHSPAYELHRADLIHGQTGTSASVVVSNGRATFTLHDGQRENTYEERVESPMVAGPTMFGFIVAHWDELTRGAALPIRFAVLERGESIGFVLKAVDAPAGRTIVTMTPSSLLVPLAVAPTSFEFHTSSRRILEYTGRVPPLDRKGDRLATLDARVVYAFDVTSFR